MKISKFTTLLFIVLTFLLSNVSNSQVKFTTTKYKPAAFIVEFDLNYNQPLPQAFGELADFFTFKSYGLKYGMGSHINMKLITDKKGRIRPYFSLGYDLMMNTSGDQAYIGANTTLQYPFSGNQTGSPVPGTSKIWMHVFNASLGFEYAFTNKTRWTPYLNIDGGLNMIFGTYRQQPTGKDEISFTIKQAARIGGSIGAGIDGRVTRVFGVAFGLKYRLANINRTSELSSELNKFELDDAANSSLNDNMTSGRTIHYLSFYLGAVFYIGKK